MTVLRFQTGGGGTSDIPGLPWWGGGERKQHQQQSYLRCLDVNAQVPRAAFTVDEEISSFLLRISSCQRSPLLSLNFTRIKICILRIQQEIVFLISAILMS